MSIECLWSQNYVHALSHLETSSSESGLSRTYPCEPLWPPRTHPPLHGLSLDRQPYHLVESPESQLPVFAHDFPSPLLEPQGLNIPAQRREDTHTKGPALVIREHYWGPFLEFLRSTHIVVFKAHVIYDLIPDHLFNNQNINVELADGRTDRYARKHTAEHRDSSHCVCARSTGRLYVRNSWMRVSRKPIHSSIVVYSGFFSSRSHSVDIPPNDFGAFVI